MTALPQVSRRVRVDVSAGIATVTLDSAQNGNAIGLDTATQLLAAARRCRQPDVRAVLLTATGRSFCVGGDLREFAALEPTTRREHLGEVTAMLHEAVSEFVTLPSPVVAAACGNIAGAGVSLLCAADLVVAAEDATISLAYTAIGYTPDGGASWLLPRIVGHRRAMELLLLNRRLGAVQAREWGLVNAVVPAERLSAQARGLVSTLASGSRDALGETKRLSVDGWTRALVPSLADEAATIGRAAASPDGVEGVAAFLTKRRPDFDRPPLRTAQGA